MSMVKLKLYFVGLYGGEYKPGKLWTNGNALEKFVSNLEI